MFHCRVIKINDGNIQHYSDNILNSNEFMSTTYTLFHMSTSYLEYENDVLKYVKIHIPLQRQIQDIRIIWTNINIYLPQSIDFCIGGKLIDEIINGFFAFLERFFSDVNSLPTKWCLDWERNDVAQ